MTAAKLDALIGATLGSAPGRRYRLDALLGAGGMGAVYRATTVPEPGADSPGEPVAIKILHPDIGADPSIRKRFEREAQAAARLDHRHCVRVRDYGTSEGGLEYLVMDLLVGEELGERLGEPWAVDAALDLLEQVLAGLEHAHGQGLVHRDLKPENVFLAREADGREVAKIVDFGIAKLLDADGAVEVLTRAGMVFGTPRYMSPEQAAGGKVDERTDLYAVGVLAHELLSGQPPFDSEDLGAILRMQIMAPPPPLPSSVPAPVAGFVASLLEKSRHERPASATDALATLRSLRAGLRQPMLADNATLAVAAIDGLGATGEHPAARPSASDPDAPLPSNPEAMPGHRVAGRYTLDKLLGMGGMGAVFRGRDERTGAVVAVKLLHAAMAADEELVARFEREARTAAELDHPNIVPVFEHGTTPGAAGPAPYLVMPLLEGVELRALIEPNGVPTPMPPDRAVALMIQLLGALAHAHAHGVVHRDLKPENVFVSVGADGREQLQLVDFGLAKVAEGGSANARALTRFGQVFGTPAYMSPEQCRGEVVDARTDLYAAGAMLYELLAGHPPFDADDVIELLRMQIVEPPPPLPGHVPAALRAVVEQLLAKPREVRYGDATTVVHALRAAVMPAVSPGAGSPPVEPTGPVPGPSPLSAIPRRAWMIGGAVLAVLVVIAAWPTGDGSSPDDGAAGPSASGEAAGAAADQRAVPSGVYLEIDRALTAKAADEALRLIALARDDYPNDGGLLWREGRALALDDDDAQRVTALHRYAEALTADPALAKQTELIAELGQLLRDADLRATAIDVAVRELGPIGHSFLLELINDESAELSYVDRQRIRAELGRDPSLVPRIDFDRQLRLDLEQAATAPAPCAAFADALDRVAASGEAELLAPLSNSKLAVPDRPGVGEDASDCEGLAARREQVRAELAAAHPDEAAKLEASKKKTGKKKRGFRLPF